MRIVVMGSGGLGGYFGGLLARSGVDVRFVARGGHLQALQERGLTVRSVNGDFTVPVQASADLRGFPPADVVLFCVKTYDAAAGGRAPAASSRGDDDCLDAPKRGGHGSGSRRDIWAWHYPGGRHTYGLYACGPWSD